MKQVLALILALAVATPAVAGPREHNRHSGYNKYNTHHVQHYRHRSGDKWVVPLIGGVIIGAVINEASKPKSREVIVVKQKCEPVTIIVQDQWGRTIERRTEECCTTVY